MDRFRLSRFLGVFIVCKFHSSTLEEYIISTSRFIQLVRRFHDVHTPCNKLVGPMSLNVTEQPPLGNIVILI